MTGEKQNSTEENVRIARWLIRGSGIVLAGRAALTDIVAKSGEHQGMMGHVGVSLVLGSVAAQVATDRLAVQPEISDKQVYGRSITIAGLVSLGANAALAYAETQTGLHFDHDAGYAALVAGAGTFIGAFAALPSINRQAR
jgi:hypothetical protein